MLVVKPDCSCMFQGLLGTRKGFAVLAHDDDLLRYRLCLAAVRSSAKVVEGYCSRPISCFDKSSGYRPSSALFARRTRTSLVPAATHSCRLSALIAVNSLALKTPCSRALVCLASQSGAFCFAQIFNDLKNLVCDVLGYRSEAKL